MLKKVSWKKIIIIVVLLVLSIGIVDSDVALSLPDDQLGEAIPSNPDDEHTNPPEPSTPAHSQAPNTSSSSGGNTTTPQRENDTAESNRRTDTRLSALSINCGSLVPEFSPDVYEYRVYVTKEQEIKNCGTSAEAMLDSASITAEGPLEFSDKDIEKKITVTGTDGEKSEYVIKVHIVGNKEILSDGKLYKMTDIKELSLLPAGFEKKKVKISNEEIVAARSRDNNILLLQYYNELDENDIKWYRFDSKNESFYPIEIREINGEKYLILSSGKEFIYGNSNGKEGYYVYNQENDTMEFVLSEKNKRQEDVNDSKIKIAFYIAIAGSLFLLVLCGVLYNRLKKTKQQEKKEIKYFRPYLSLEEEQNKKA